MALIQVFDYLYAATAGVGLRLHHRGQSVIGNDCVVEKVLWLLWESSLCPQRLRH